MLGTGKLRNYVREYDGLRGLAFILVAIHHLGLRDRWPVGPDIFFVLSGLFITKGLLSRRDASRISVLLTFHKRRAMRLLPPVFTVIAVVFLVTMVVPAFEPDIWRMALAAITFSINWQQSHAVIPSGKLCHLWSLAAEQQFYLLWPPIMLLAPRKGVLPLLVALLCCAVAWRLHLLLGGASSDRLYFGLDTHADALLLGCILAFLAVPQRHVTLVRRTGTVALILILVAEVAFPAGSARNFALALTVTTFLAGAAVMAVPLGGRLSPFLLWRPLQIAGRCSYSLYLCHFPIVIGFNPHWPHGVKLAQVVLSVACAGALYVLVEKPLVVRLQRQKTATRRPEMSGGTGRSCADRPAGDPLSAAAPAVPTRCHVLPTGRMPAFERSWRTTT